VGRLVGALIAQGRDLSQAEPSDLEAADPRFEPADLDLADPALSVTGRQSPGGGSPDSVRSQVEALRDAVSTLL
jgi:argininosuccinate lyase